MLMLENVTCSSRGKTRLHVDHFTTQAGQLTGIVGPNGAGKTTLFKVICGELPSSGTILLHDKPIGTWPALHKARHLAVLSQSNPLNFPLTAQEVVTIGLTPLSIGKHEASFQVQEHMQLTNCLHLAGQSYPSLSGGERQRVQLARVLLQLSQAENAPLLLLDEPTSAQDLGQQHSVLGLVSSLCQQRQFSTLAILHDLNQVMRYCDNCALLNHGQLVLKGPPSDVLCEESIEHHWQYRPTRLQNDSYGTVFI